MSKPKLKACPFCGDKGEYRRGGSTYAPWGYAAHCRSWCAESPELDTIEEAAKWWNHRPKKKT